jgi:hypothetical protein
MGGRGGKKRIINRLHFHKMAAPKARVSGKSSLSTGGGGTLMPTFQLSTLTYRNFSTKISGGLEMAGSLGHHPGMAISQRGKRQTGRRNQMPDFPE